MAEHLRDHFSALKKAGLSLYREITCAFKNICFLLAFLPFPATPSQLPLFMGDPPYFLTRFISVPHKAGGVVSVKLFASEMQAC